MMTDEEVNNLKIMQLSVGKVVAWHRPNYPNHILYVHVVRFNRKHGWSLETGIVVNCYEREITIPLEEIQL